ncbi:translation initiation factor IF-2-like [Panicum virgatum]|uniref:VQ domain-containing protein n=1 Tax=Panicum virgatum TaxID=38727 RepID=A0A8T0RE86_PANVG|nr:translation initiation factor IF-2-like [Panicum virgatum]KAG2583774.1 hypothetical protein PVAP13_6KG241506 [Panicum virgatum]
MDSGNSASLQSSSGGGGDEYDAACGGGPAAADSSSPLSALLRHHHPDFGGGTASLIYGLEELGAPPLSHWCPATAPLPQAVAGAPASPPCHGGPAASAPAADHAAAATAAAQPAQQARGSRKRARASRRAPTTVLTTDTSNFRAMVQEFTGIPAPPFAGASPAARARLDHLFPSRSSSALPQYLIRPFAHGKLHAQTPPASSPAPACAAIAAFTAAHAGATAVASGDDSYSQQLTAAAPPALLGMQGHGICGSNSYLSFQGAVGAQLDDGGGANKYPLFDDRGSVAPSSAPRPQDPAGFLGLARSSIASSEGARPHLHPRNGGRGDELSGLVGGCKETYSSAPPPPLERNGRISPASGVSTAATTTPVAAAMRTQGADSWVCGTSE